MSNCLKPAPKRTGLPKVTIEIVEITPEQRRNGQPGKARRIEGTNSWVRGMVDLMIVYLSNTDGNFQNTTDTTLECDASASPKFSFIFGSSLAGVQVGTGVTAVDRDDFNVETRILEGNSAGRLTYDANGALTKSTAITGGYRVQLERSFNNDSGGSITINEAGVVVATRITTPGTVVSPMILRDLISPGHVVVDGGAVIIRYLLDWLA